MTASGSTPGESGLNRPRRHTLAPVLCIGLLTWSAAQAQSSSAPVQSPDATVAFDLPVQPLAQSLNSLAVQAGIQIFFEQDTVAGLTAPSVNGSMGARQALHSLLANTNLDFAQDKSGAFVVRRKIATPAHARRKSPKSSTVAAAPALVTPAAAEPRTARDAEGPWVLRLRAEYLDPRNRSDFLTVPGTPPGFVPTDGTRTNSRWAPEIDLEYFLSNHWSTELALNWPQVHDLNLRGSTLGTGTFGDFRMMPNFLTGKYNFNPDGTFRPYLGGGLNVTSFYGTSAGPFSLTRTTVGPAAQAGFDIRLSEHWALNADVKWARVRPAISDDGAPLGRMKVDPVLYGVGVGYRFGGSPPPPPTVVAPAKAVAPPPPADSDGDGVPDSLDQCPNTPRGVQVDAHGCPLDSDHDGVPDYLDKCPATPPGLKVDQQGCEIEELILKGVTFDTNSATLTGTSATVLDEVVAVLKQRPNDKAEIRGYTDSRGSATYNKALSERRAASVVAYLASHGISSANLTSAGFGKDNPIASNDTAEGRAQNRRVTVSFSVPVRR